MAEQALADLAFDAYVAAGGDPNPEAYVAFRQRQLDAERAEAARQDQLASDRYAQERAADAERRRILEQRSAAEVPGFHARTTIDDTIGKLYALRCRLRTPIPNRLDGLLDDIERLTEQAVEMALDPDTEYVADTADKGLLATASGCVGWCSCGAEMLYPPEPSSLKGG